MSTPRLNNDPIAIDSVAGLDDTEALARQARFGPNRLAEPEPRPRWRRFADQFRSGIVFILAAAAVLAGAVGDWKDPIVIAVVLLVNGALGYVQEARADAALASLRKMLASKATVRRGGRVRELPADELVPGDVVLLEACDRIPADGHLVVAVSAAVAESTLTGESVPIDKVARATPNTNPDPERRDQVFMNTTLVRGRAEMVVTATGMATEVGKIAELLREQEAPATPLQQQLDRLGARLALVALGAVTVVFGLRLFQGDGLGDALLASVALAVAAIPEGLPAVVTLTLAIGVSQMAKRNAIVKQLHSVETLGSTTAICSDKTGTLTANEMTVVRVATSPEAPMALVAGEPIQELRDIREARELLENAVLANDAEIDADGGVVGDPTEAAFIAVARELGIDVDASRAQFPRIGEVPFDSATKLMATVHRDGSELLVCAKGAPDVVIQRCGSSQVNGITVELDGRERDRWVACNEAMAADGLRVLAVASARVPLGALDPGSFSIDDLRDLRLDGLVGMVDPPRPEVRDAIAVCSRAGIDVKMITGDHASTASAIARELGIDGDVVTGVDLDAMDDDELARRIDQIGVCARVSPADKVRVVRALHRRGHVVAMTGDGVNDAAALRVADIGVAMGITGTEVTKEAGDMVLADDNFATIVNAVRAGRGLYDNIVKFVRFQLTTNLGAIATIVTASALGLPVPLSAIQVLWVNIIADGPPAMSLGVDPPSPSVMQRRPRPRDAAILTRGRLGIMALAAATMAAGTLSVYWWSLDRYDEDVAATMAFTTFVLFQVANVFNARSEHRSVFGAYTLRNGKLWAAATAVALLQVAAVTWGPLRSLFGTTSLTIPQLAVCLATALSVIAVEELRKLAAHAVGSRRVERTAQSGRARRAETTSPDSSFTDDDREHAASAQRKEQ